MTPFSPGQLLLTGVPGPDLDAETARRLKDVQPGGFILFTRNIQSPAQLRKLIDDLRDLSDVEPVITIDQEGGRVSRLRELGNEPPNAQQLREKGDPALITRHGELTAQILRLFGFNLDLCPVLDVSYDGDAHNSLRGRCWGTDPQEVISNAGVFNAALRKGGILSCGKHFPGYMRTGVDPHHDLDVIDRTRKELEAEELLPFRAVGPDVDSMMIGHVHYPVLDPDHPGRPATLAPEVVTGLLRNEMAYKGLIMTDDMDMGPILKAAPFKDVIQDAVTAGNDMVMICHRLNMVEEALGHIQALPESTLTRAFESIEKAKNRLYPPTKFTEERFAEIDARIWDLRVATLGEQAAATRSPEDGARSPVELY